MRREHAVRKSFVTADRRSLLNESACQQFARRAPGSARYIIICEFLADLLSETGKQTTHEPFTHHGSYNCLILHVLALFGSLRARADHLSSLLALCHAEQREI